MEGDIEQACMYVHTLFAVSTLGVRVISGGGGGAGGGREGGGGGGTKEGAVEQKQQNAEIGESCSHWGSLPTTLH